MNPNKSTILIGITCLSSLLAVQLTFAEEETSTEQQSNPCDFLVVTSSGEDSESTSTSETLSETLARFDECLDSLMFDVGGSLDDSGIEGAESNQSQNGEGNTDSSTTTTNTPTSISQSLKDFDTQLANLEVELEPTGTDATKGDSSDSPSTNDAESRIDPNTHQDEDEGQDEEQTRAKRQSDAQHTKSDPVPLDPDDEDIVLKQIREAAEKETDEKTKQALWDQYYDYADSRK